MLAATGRMQSGIAVTLLFLVGNCSAAQLSAAAKEAFDKYVVNVEARLNQQHARPETHLASFPAEADRRNAWQRQLTSGDVQLEAVNRGNRPLDGALLHHWRGTAFVPNATPQDMVTLLRNVDHAPRYYAPEVVSSRVLTDDGETATLAMRLKEHKVLTIVLDGEFTFGMRLLDGDRGYSASRSTHLWEVDKARTAGERRRPEGDDDGFLWRLNSYWSFARATMDDASHPGLLIELEAVSLTRDIPPGLGWLIAPIIGDFPRETLGFTLRATKKALMEDAGRENKR
jgi:hypothetical protein